MHFPQQYEICFSRNGQFSTIWWHLFVHGGTMMKEHLPQPSWCLDIADSGGTTYQLLSSGFALPSNTEADPILVSHYGHLILLNQQVVKPPIPTNRKMMLVTAPFPSSCDTRGFSQLPALSFSPKNNMCEMQDAVG